MSKQEKPTIDAAAERLKSQLFEQKLYLIRRRIWPDCNGSAATPTQATLADLLRIKSELEQTFANVAVLRDYAGAAVEVSREVFGHPNAQLVERSVKDQAKRWFEIEAAKRGIDRRHRLARSVENNLALKTAQILDECQLATLVNGHLAASRPNKSTARGRSNSPAAPPQRWEQLQQLSSISQIQAARLLGCDPRTVRRRVDDRRLKQSSQGRIICDDLLRIEIRKVHGRHVLR